MEASKIFEPDTVQVIEARRFVNDSLRDWGCDPDDVSLLVSELATNAVLHARSDFTVRVQVESDPPLVNGRCLPRRHGCGCRVRVEVFDRNSRLPSFAVVPADAYSGRGLMLVQALAATWGVESHSESGKTIWFEVQT